MVDDGVALMARPKRKATEAPDDVRVAAVVLKDTPEYRDWLTGLSSATLIPIATIVRDALARWAADRGFPAPPSGAARSPRRIGDRGPSAEGSTKPKGKGGK
jgi:hypothetical protein